MSTVTQLPPSIANWLVLYDLFDDQLAADLELLVHRLSSGIGFQHELSQRMGEPDGYRGIVRRGPVSRLLLSELAMADEMPDEFIRRVSQSEAGYYELATAEGAISGRLVALFDAGPTQLGAARIGHLATILLLWRRAVRLGVALEIGTLQQPNRLQQGELRELVTWWLDGRTSEPPGADALAQVAEQMSTDDEWWVCCSESTAAALEWPEGVEVVTFAEWGESAGGASHLLARHRVRHAVVPLPSRPDAVRLLRGAAFRRHASEVQAPGLRNPGFGGAATTLLCRTSAPEVLVVCPVPMDGHARSAKPRPRRFRGPVIAAGFVGRRTVALTYADGCLAIEVVGKKLADLDNLTIPLADLQLRESDLDLLGSTAPRQLHFHAGSLLVELPSGWWDLVRGRPPFRTPIVAAAPTETVDQPRLAYRVPHGVWVEGGGVRPAPVEASVLLGGRSIGWGRANEWTIDDGGGGEIAVQLETPPVGIVNVHGSPMFVELSRGGHIVRLVGRSTRTVTQLSGDIIHIAVHPLAPLVAIQRHDFSVIVFDLFIDQVVMRISGDEA